MSIYIIDIETKPKEKLIETFNKNIKVPGNYKKPETIEAYLNEARGESAKKMSTDTDYSEIRCIGISYDDKREIVTLEQLADILNEDSSFHLVTFNGKKFDIPIIIKRGIEHGVNLPYRELLESCKRYNNSRHTDLMEALGFGEYVSLDKLATVYLGRSKEPIDFDSCTDAELYEHCLDDVEITEALYDKFSKLF